MALFLLTEALNDEENTWKPIAINLEKVEAIMPSENPEQTVVFFSDTPDPALISTPWETTLALLSDALITTVKH